MFVFFKVLLDWINDELSELRIVLRDITEDLYDGQILAILMGMLIIFFSVIQTIIMLLLHVQQYQLIITIVQGCSLKEELRRLCILVKLTFYLTVPLKFQLKSVFQSNLSWW